MELIKSFLQCTIALALALCGAVSHAGTATSNPFVFMASSIYDSTSAFDGGTVTYTTQVSLAPGTYYLYVNLLTGQFSLPGSASPPAPVSSNPTLTAALAASVPQYYSTNLAFSVYPFTIASTVPAGTTITFTPKHGTWTDVNSLTSLKNGGAVALQMSIGSRENSSVVADVDSSAGGNFLVFSTASQYGYLNVAVTGSGSVASNPDVYTCASGTCTYTIPQGTSITLTATPASSAYAFQGWSGACGGSSPTCVVTLGASAGVTATFGAASVTPQSGFWWNPAEGGRGYNIEQQGSTLFMATFLYDPSGRSTWYGVGPGAMSGATYAGTLQSYSGGQTLTGAYQQASMSGSGGAFSITFQSATQATINWPGGVEQIQRYDFGPGGSQGTQPAGTPQAGWWWAPNEGGRGYAIEIQGGTLFLAGYMYDTSGNPVWYASGPAAMSNGYTYQGTWQQLGNGQTLTGSYKPASVTNANAGSVTVLFGSATGGTLVFPDGRQVAIQRYNFQPPGPVTVNVAAAIGNLVNNGLTQSFTLSGYINNSTPINPMPNTPITGSGTLTIGPATSFTYTSGTLKGTAALRQVQALSGTATENGQSASLAAMNTIYYKPGTYNILEEVTSASSFNDYLYGAYTYPTTVKAGDTGTLGTASTGGFISYTRTDTYSVAADSPTSLLVTITDLLDQQVAGTVTSQTVYRISTTGSISFVSQTTSNALLGSVYEQLIATFK